MNQIVRSYLIDVARRKNNTTVYYSELVKECHIDLDLNNEFDRKDFSNLLGEISAYEHKHKRPLLTALAIYKNKEENDQGNGFFHLAESLGYGKWKKLKEDFWGFEEVNRCRTFWQNPDNYAKYFELEGSSLSQNHDIDFFKLEELQFFSDWKLTPYDNSNPDHIDAKNQIMETVWEKSIHLAKLITTKIPKFTYEAKKAWNQRGWRDDKGKMIPSTLFKPYTWVKIFKEDDKNKEIFFTIGIDANKKAFVYKMDCQNQGESKLTKNQIDSFNALLKDSLARWNQTHYTELVKHDWESLTSLCTDFILEYMDLYDEVIKVVWGDAIVSKAFKNTLLRRDRPTHGYERIPETERTFQGVKVDFAAKNKELKDLGDYGEALVLAKEVENLIEIGRHEEANKVCIVDDGRGFDVLSYDEEGEEKYIEVKTTTGNHLTPFHLSENEIACMETFSAKYCIYRVYNYNQESNCGEFFEICPNVKDNLLLKATNYKVYLKSEKSSVQ